VNAPDSDARSGILGHSGNSSNPHSAADAFPVPERRLRDRHASRFLPKLVQCHRFYGKIGVKNLIFNR
jgi:hypothetical protein